MTLADYGYSPEPFAMLFVLFILLFAVAAVLGAIIYIIHALAYYEMSKKLQLKRDWYGFVPFFRDMACGNIASGREKSRFGRLLAVFSALYACFSLIFIAFFGVSFINLVFEADSAMLNGLSELPKDAFLTFNSLIIPAALMLVTGIAYKVMRLIGEFRIYRKFAPSSAVLFLILGIIIPVLTPIFLFSIRKSSPVGEKTSQSIFDFE